MTLAGLFLTSTGLGLAVAAPVGPMALICMRRTIALGWQHGLATGAGIAAGDGFYAGVAAFGLAGVSGFLLAHDRLLHASAGAFLVYLAVKPLLARWASGIPEANSLPDETAAAPRASNPDVGTGAGTSPMLQQKENATFRFYRKIRRSRMTHSRLAAFASAVLLTLANPPTIILFTVIFAALTPTSGFDARAAAMTVAGVVIGSLLWWCGLIAAVTLFQQVVATKARRLIDLIVAVVLVLFGMAELIKAFATVAVAAIPAGSLATFVAEILC